MYIKTVSIENFGPIANLQCHLEKDKINFILGERETGKTSFMAAIYATLKKENYIYYESNSKRIANVKIELDLSGKDIEICKQYKFSNSEMKINKLTNFSKQMQEIESVEIIIIKDLDIGKEEIDYKTISVFLKNYRNKIKNKKLYEIILQRLINPPENIFRISYGEQKILRIMNILANIKQGSIVICDDILEGNDAETTKFILELMYEIKDVQFIITRSLYVKNIISENYSNNIVIRNVTREINPVGNLEMKWQEYKININKYEDKITYYKDEVLEEEEERPTEYKEITGDNPCGSIIDTAPIYAVSFLNTRKIKSGCVKWGITDLGKVVGVVLNKQQKDKIRRRICEELKGIKPYIGADDYEIKFRNVFLKSGEILKDTYIVELVIQVKEQQFLYSTSRNEVHIKTEGGKIKLTPLEIQEELLRRNKIG